MQDNLPGSDQEALAHLVEESNETLENAGQSAATRALNLGCSMSLIPALLLVAATFIFTRGNWIAAGIVFFLVLIGVLGIANWMAFTARNNSVKRIYQEQVSREIERSLRSLGADRITFDRLADEMLPEQAILRNYLSNQS
jgi:hypothetical protein